MQESLFGALDGHRSTLRVGDHSGALRDADREMIRRGSGSHVEKSGVHREMEPLDAGEVTA